MSSQKECFFKIFSSFLILILIGIALNCARAKDSTYMELRNYVDTIRVIDTHEHQRWPVEFENQEYNFFTLLSYSYLKADLVSAGAPQLDKQLINQGQIEKLWEAQGPYLNFTRNTTYYSHFLRGFEVHYGFSDPYFTEDNVIALSNQIAENYKNRNAWYATAFQNAGFELMLVDQYWNVLNMDLDEKYFALVMNVNPFLYGIVQSHEPFKQEGTGRGTIMELSEEEGISLMTLDDYLSYADKIFKRFLEHDTVCLKNSAAYSRTLYYEDIPLDKAKSLYDLPIAKRSQADNKMLMDFMFHWLIKKSIEYDLPVQIHTGYLAGNGNTLENSYPLRLNNLFLKYPKAKFILFHGGYPWTGEYAAMGKMFPNVYLDIVWLPQISREEAVSAFDEMLDTVPYNKFFWGGDCHFIEESTGSLEFGKDVVTQVLAARIKRGLMTQDTALDILNKIFRENAVRVFKLEERLQRSF